MRRIRHPPLELGKIGATNPSETRFLEAPQKRQHHAVAGTSETGPGRRCCSWYTYLSKGCRALTLRGRRVVSFPTEVNPQRCNVKPDP